MKKSYLRNILLLVVYPSLIFACNEMSVNNGEVERVEQAKLEPEEKVNAKDSLDSIKVRFMENFKEPFFTKIDSIQQKGDTVIELKTNQAQITFSGYSDTEDGYKYTYVGHDEKNDFHLVKGSFWEGYEYYLIDNQSGIVDTIWNLPYFNDVEPLFVCKSMDYGLEGAPNGIQVWKKNNQGGWIKIKELNQSIWVPLRMSWFEGDVIVEIVSVINFQSDKVNEETKEYLLIGLN